VPQYSYHLIVTDSLKIFPQQCFEPGEFCTVYFFGTGKLSCQVLGTDNSTGLTVLFAYQSQHNDFCSFELSVFPDQIAPPEYQTVHPYSNDKNKRISSSPWR
jgi:hypothetical protein